MQEHHSLLRKVGRVIMALVVLNVLITLAAWWTLHHYWYQQRTFEFEQDTYGIKRGDTVAAVVNDLVDANMVGDRMLTKLSLRLFAPDLLVKAGRYTLPKQGAYADLFAVFHAGVSVQYRVTIVEGWTLAQSIQAVVSEFETSAVPHSAVIDATQLLSAQARDAMAGAVHAEGWFYPDTYYFSEGDNPQDILSRAHTKMLHVLFDEWPKRAPNLPYQSPYEALIMASLIERETGVGTERAMIAGVFVGRLSENMRLQTDPSVIYGLGAGFDGNLRRADLKRDTAYNTYTRHGLPPTPIALPGRKAIHAALHPAQTDARYFVAKGDGSHYFSVTLDEHLHAVRNYQINNRAEHYRSAPKLSK